MMTLRILSRLLDYPDEALFTHSSDLIAALDDATELNLQQSARLVRFINQLCARPLLDVQADYCELFDRGRATSLLLFEHVHGESRDRGQAMVDLLEQYRADGLELDSKELPDFLPLYLEYLACKSDEAARQGLDDIVPILDAGWDEEQIKFLGEQGCASAQQAMHQRRFADAVAPQYLDIAAATARTTGESA